MLLNYLTVPANTPSPQGLIVLLHGWGANARDVQTLAPYLKQPSYQYIFPEAPFPHPSTPSGKMWYDLTPDLQFESTPGFGDRPDVSQSRQQLTDLLQKLAQTTGVPLSRTILAGFSQGGAMTLDVGLSLPLAGLMVLSGYLHAPLAAQFAPPTLMVHGIQDRVVPITAARQAKNALQAQGIAVQYQEYEGMGHEISLLVLQQMQAFIHAVLPPSVNVPEETTIG